MSVEFCGDHKAHADSLEHIDRRLTKHGEEIDKLTSIAVRLTTLEEKADEREERQDGRIDDHEERMRAIEAAPAKRWNDAVGYVLAAFAGSLGTSIAGVIPQLFK